MRSARVRDGQTEQTANPEPADEHCTHLTHGQREDALDELAASLSRSAAQAAAIDLVAESLPPGSDVVEQVAWIVARRRAERDELEPQQPGVEPASGR